MTDKINAKELREIKNESYDKWFERWYKKEDLPKKLKEAAMKGYTGYIFEIDDTYSEYKKRRMRDDRFVKKLKEKLETFEVNRIEPTRFKRELFGHILGYGWTNLKIEIHWRNSDE